MHLHTLVAIGIRLFALWLFIANAKFFPALLYALDQTGQAAGKALSVSMIGMALLAISAVLWAFPMTAARLLVPASAPADPLPVAGDRLARVGAALIGLFLCSTAFPALVGLLVYSGIALQEFDEEVVADIAMYATRLLLGLLLMAKSQQIANRLLQLKHGSA